MSNKIRYNYSYKTQIFFQKYYNKNQEIIVNISNLKLDKINVLNLSWTNVTNENVYTLDLSNTLLARRVIPYFATAK